MAVSGADPGFSEGAVRKNVCLHYLILIVNYYIIIKVMSKCLHFREFDRTTPGSAPASIDLERETELLSSRDIIFY